MKNHPFSMKRVSLLCLVSLFLSVTCVCPVCSESVTGAAQPDSFSAGPAFVASGSIYVTFSNPNLVNYGYTDTEPDRLLLDILIVVIRSDWILDKALDCELEIRDADGVLIGTQRLADLYPDLTPAVIREAVSLSPIKDTPFVRINCGTDNPRLSADLVNALLLVVPDELSKILQCSVQVVDFATVPVSPDSN